MRAWRECPMVEWNSGTPARFSRGLGIITDGRSPLQTLNTSLGLENDSHGTRKRSPQSS
jgi:hypothetical protein